jgi:hypothetical protein
MPTHLQLANKLMEDFARSGDDERISYYNTDDGRRVSLTVVFEKSNDLSVICANGNIRVFPDVKDSPLGQIIDCWSEQEEGRIEMELDSESTGLLVTTWYRDLLPSLFALAGWETHIDYCEISEDEVLLQSVSLTKK